MGELTPDIEAMLDKGFGSPAPGADKAETAPALPPPPEAPAPTSEETPQIGSDVIMMRADYTKKMMALAEERKRYQTYAELEQRLDTDDQFRARFERALNEDDPGQAAAPGQSDLDTRLRALETSIRQREQFDQRSRQQAHFDASVKALDQVREEFQLSDKDAQVIYQNAIDVGALHTGVPINRLFDVLSMSAARFVLPRARSDGQRTLLEQMKDKGRTASPARETALPPAPEPDVTKMSEAQYQAHLIAEYERAQRGQS